jgi:hypothetical protein
LWLLAGSVYAQPSFQKKLDAFLPAPRIRTAPGGQSCYVADVFLQNGAYRLSVYHLDGQGEVLWRSEQTDTEPGLQLKTLVATDDGIILLTGADSPDHSNSYLIKFYADGSLAWKRQIGTVDYSQAFDLESDDTGALWLSGLHLRTLSTVDSAYYYLAKLNSEGAWIESRENYFRYLFTGREKCRYTDLTWNYADHSLLFVEDFKQPFTQSFMTLFNRERFSLGYCTQALDFDERFTPFQFAHLEHADTVLLFSGHTLRNDFYDEQPVIGRLSRNGRYDVDLKVTPSLYRPLSARSADAVFYVPAEQSLLKLDASLQPIWSLKLDNCVETNAFDGEVAADGSIYCVRNVGQRSVVARISPQGSLPSCPTYAQALPVLRDTSVGGWNGLSPTGYPLQNVPSLLQSASIAATTAGSTDFCTRLDANFEVPEQVCLNTELVPAGVDTQAGLWHRWNIDTRQWTDSLPELNFPTLGTVEVLHRVENGICHDTALRSVEVLRRPEIGLSDTLVCGSSELSLDLGSRGAERYFLDSVEVASVFTIDRSGVFTIRLENDACFVEMPLSIRIVAFEPPILPLDTAFCYGTPVALQLRADFDRVYWDGSPVPDSFIISDGALHRYLARYQPDTSCVVEGVVSIPRKRCDGGQQVLYVPNVFSPETGAPFQAFPTPVAEIRSMQLYDRWGSLVYTQAGPSPEWDGNTQARPAPPGIYVYQIGYLDLRDNTIAIQSGDVLLMR